MSLSHPTSTFSMKDTQKKKNSVHFLLAIIKSNSLFTSQKKKKLTFYLFHNAHVCVPHYKSSEVLLPHTHTQKKKKPINCHSISSAIKD